MVSWVMLATAFVGLMLFLNARIETLLDSDMSSELVLSRLLAEEKKILTPNWYYSTELRVLNTQLFYAFFFRLTSNWHWVRILSYVCMTMALIATYRMLCSAMKCEKYFAITAAILLLPFSAGYFTYVLKGAYYIPHIAITFATLALSERYLRQSGEKAMLFLGTNIVLAVIAGMGGPRQVLVLYLPLAVAAVLVWYKKRNQATAWRKLAGMMAVVLGAGAGYGINTVYLARRYHFRQWDEMKFVGLDFSRLSQIFNGFLFSYGYQTGGLFSKKVLLANGACALWLLMTVGMIVYVVRNRERVSEQCYRFAVFTGAAFGIYVLLYLFTNMSYSDRYNFPVIVLSIPLIAVFSKEANGLKNWKKNTAVLLFVALICLNSAVFYRDTGRQDNTGELRKVEQTLAEQQYTAGYATFWRANIMTELSNGNIEMWDWCDGGIENIHDINQTYHWLQPVSHDTEHPDGKVFILLSKDELNRIPWNANLRRERLIYRSNSYMAFGYNSYDEMCQEVVDSDTKN